MAAVSADLAPGLAHVELYTSGGLLTLMWHGDPALERVALMSGGAMGSLLGPARALYHDLGVALAAEGIGVIRVGYRRPNDLDDCVLDVCAAAQIAFNHGARAFVTVGHSFGGAVAVRAAIDLPEYVRGVVTLSTQSAGCEAAALLGGRPLLLVHGEADTILPVAASEMVCLMAGAGDLMVMPGAGHGLAECADDLRRLLLVWIPAALAGDPPPASAILHG
jgi:hypothetical protein